MYSGLNFSIFVGRCDAEGVAVASHDDVDGGVLAQLRYEVETHSVKDGKETTDGGLHGSALDTRDVVGRGANALRQLGLVDVEAPTHGADELAGHCCKGFVVVAFGQLLVFDVLNVVAEQHVELFALKLLIIRIGWTGIGVSFHWLKGVELGLIKLTF